MYEREDDGAEDIYNNTVSALLRSITLFTAIALLVFVALHAVVPHNHPGHDQAFHGSEIPPIAHVENKIFVLIFVAVLLPFLFNLMSRMALFVTEVQGLLCVRKQRVMETVPVRWSDALRRGRIHSRADEIARMCF